MDSRTKLSPTLITLINEYEHSEGLGKALYLTEKEYRLVISYYKDDGEYPQAIRVIDNAISQYSFRSDFLILKARVLVKQGLLDDAMEVASRAESLSPSELDIQLLKVNIYIRQKDFDEAIILIEDLKINASNQELEMILTAEAFLYEVVQEFEQMFQCLERVLLLNQNNEEALILMNMAMAQSKNFEESVDIHKDIVDNYPYNHLAWYNLGHAYAGLCDYETAIWALEFTYVIEPQFEAGYLDCAEFCRDNKQFEEALSIYNEALEMFGADFDLLIAISECQYTIGLVDKAKRSLFEAIELDSYSEEAYFLLAKCYMENKDWRSAVKVLRKALYIENEVEEYYHALAKCYIELNNKNKALKYLKKAAVKGCELSNYWEDYVLYLMSDDNYNEALEVIEEAGKSTFSFKLQYIEAACYIGLGDIKKGLSLLEEALIESFDDHKTLYETPEQIYNNDNVQSIIKYYQDQ